MPEQLWQNGVTGEKKNKQELFIYLFIYLWESYKGSNIEVPNIYLWSVKNWRILNTGIKKVDEKKRKALKNVLFFFFFFFPVKRYALF